MGAVEGVILHSSVLLSKSNNETPTLTSATEFIFRTLQYSQLHKGICLGDDLSTDEVDLLKTLSKSYSFDCFRLGLSSPEVVINVIAEAWGDVRMRTVFVISNDKKHIIHSLQSHHLLLISDADVRGETIQDPCTHHIKKLEELPLHICRLNRKEAGNKIVTVGYSMKLSRQADFAKRGAFPLYCAEQGLMFIPLTYDLPLPLQLQEFNILLHKATDDIVSIDLIPSADAPKIAYTSGMEELRRNLRETSTCCVIDPFNNIYPVLDRLKTQLLLLGLEALNEEGCSKIRGPNFLKVDDFKTPNLRDDLFKSKLSLPCIVKPQVACGVSDAHSMAIIFKFEDCKDLLVPVPAIIQEFVDHSSTILKFYVLGEEVYHAVKKSIPSANALTKLCQPNELKPLMFDSLKSLPTADNTQLSTDALDLQLVIRAAKWLRKKLDLTIFGFDVVIQEGTGDHVIVDVNYLPSFKEVPDDVAVPAFWNAIKNKYHGWRQSNQ